MELQLELVAGEEAFGATAPTNFYVIMAKTATGKKATIATGATGYFVLKTGADSQTRYISITAPTNAAEEYTATAKIIGYIGDATADISTGTNTLTLYGAEFGTA